jgi:hypothetical protein
MLSLTTQEGEASDLFHLSWPVSADYGILPLEEYITYISVNTGKALTEEQSQLLRDKREKFGYTYAIFPKYQVEKTWYNPLNGTPNAFLDLAKIINYNTALLETPLRPTQKIKRIQSNILKWVCKNGLPYHSASNATSSGNAVVDDVLSHAKDIELFLEKHLGQYAMLQETFLALACEAHLTSKIFLESPERIDESKVYPLLAIIDRERPINIPDLHSRYHTRIEVATHIKKELLSLLEERINGYSCQVKLSLHKTNDERHPYSMMFDIPDLLTALWYQFYTLVTNTSRLDRCKGCGQLFVQTRSNREWCTSTCRVKFNKRKFDKRIKEETADTPI